MHLEEINIYMYFFTQSDGVSVEVLIAPRSAVRTANIMHARGKDDLETFIPDDLDHFLHFFCAKERSAGG